ncbi:MAG: BON domain-containing protein [Cyanobacteria bacterium CRU_2_1]|nr:BON domain-containing protein [Cyanobacteria bacterium RU_5_0]NJR61274.1 BON domain-containing protein [Cyanobacteria bacterium CRU_2_1]
MKRLSALLIGSTLLFGTIACTDARTSSDAPDTVSESTEAPEQDEAQATEDDGTSEVRERQIESDIRAREERNNVTGGDTDRADGDLESEVRGKLEANLPASQLTVDSEEGVVTIVGTVPTQPQYDRIESLAREIKGVKDVVVNVEVVPAQPDTDAPEQ